MESVNKLNPCPFCGGESRFTPPVFGVNFIECKSCGLVVSFRGGEDKMSATEKYNRRTKWLIKM